jgi:hypothetical protein
VIVPVVIVPVVIVSRRAGDRFAGAAHPPKFADEVIGAKQTDLPYARRRPPRVGLANGLPREPPAGQAARRHAAAGRDDRHVQVQAVREAVRVNVWAGAEGVPGRRQELHEHPAGSASVCGSTLRTNSPATPWNASSANGGSGVGRATGGTDEGIGTGRPGGHVAAAGDDDDGEPVEFILRGRTSRFTA